VSLGEAVVEVGADASRFGSDLAKEVDKAAQSADRSLSKIGTNTAARGKKLSLLLTAPILGIGAAAVKSQATFEQSINLLGVNAGVGGAELTKMADQAKQLGADTVFSASEAADAMLELAKSGFKPAEIAGGGVQATMALAATEGLNLADAATITGNAMNSFGIKAKNAGTIADALAGASAASSASVESLSQALAQVGPGAKNAGLTLQDTVGVLAAFDQAGIKGGDAGTSLKTMLTRLIPQTKQSATAMERLGLFSKTTGSAFVDNKGNFKNIADVAGILQRKLGKLSEAQKATALQTIFGSDATRAATVLLNNGRAGIEKYITASTKQGTAQKLADARMKGTAGAIEQMKGSIDTASIALGEALAPTVKDVAGKIQGLANWFSHLDSGTQHTVATIGALVAALGPVLFIVGKVTSGVGSAIKSFDTFAKSMQTAEGRSAKLQTGLRGAAGAGGMLLLADASGRAGTKLGLLESAAGGALSGAALGAFAGPVGAGIGAAIGGLAGGALALSRNTKSAGDSAKGSIGDWKTYAGTLDQVSGATTEATRAMILQKAEASGLLTKTRAAGVQDRAVVNAILNGGKARDNVAAAVKREVAAMDASIAAKKADLAANIAIASDNSIPLSEQTKAANRNKALRSEIDTMQKKRDAEAKANGTILAGIGAVQKSITKTQEAAAATRDLTGKLNGIPPVKRTLIQQDGIIPTTKGIVALSEKYQLTPKQVKTVIGATGVQFTQGQIDHMIKLVGIYGKLHPKPTLDLQTALAEAKIHALIAGLGMIKDKTVHVTVSTNSTVAEHAAVGKPKTAVGGVFSGAQTRVIAEAGREAVVPLDRNLSAVNPSVRYLSAIAQGKAIPLPGRAGGSSASPSPSVSTSATLIVQNPAPETTTQSLPRALSTLSFVLGGG
jgi:TP901 family phage tail tape measure protein